MDCSADQIEKLLAIVNHIVVILGVLVAIILYPKTQWEHSYEKLNDHYLRFLELQTQNPGLGTNTTDRQELWDRLTKTDRARQRLMFDYLSSILERAYYSLNRGIDKYTWWKRREWKTWRRWIEVYKQNPNYVNFWKRMDEEACYGDHFVKFIRNELGIQDPPASPPQ